jgi:hypothetical protein
MMPPNSTPGWLPVDWRSYVVWGVWFAAFVVLELLGRFGHDAGVIPWRTLSDTAWSIEAWSWIAKLVVFSGLCILLVHIVFRWP